VLMSEEERDILEFLKFELKFLEDGGLGGLRTQLGVLRMYLKTHRAVLISTTLHGRIRAVNVC